MGDLEQCKQVCENVCTQANDANSPNYNAIAGRAKSIISGAYKMEKDFVKAEEFLNSSTEVGLFLALVHNNNSLLPNYFVISLLLQASYTRIILEIATFFTYRPVKLIFKTSQFGFKDLHVHVHL